MTNSDFKQLLDEAIKPILDEQKKLREEQSKLRDTVETRVLPPLTYIETTVKSYADRYVINEDHIGRLDKRLSTVEKNLDIQPPEELTIPPLD